MRTRYCTVNNWKHSAWAWQRPEVSDVDRELQYGTGILVAKLDIGLKTVMSLLQVVTAERPVNQTDKYPFRALDAVLRLSL